VSDHPELDPNYSDEIASRLLTILGDGPADLHDLVLKSEGAYPADVRDTLEKLRTLGKVKTSPGGIWIHPRTNGRAFRPRQGSTNEPDRRKDDFFPEPHALDYDWRFTEGTLGFLARYIMSLGAHHVAVFGAPTLFKHLVDNGTAADLFDNNGEIIKRLRKAGYGKASECDLLRKFPDGKGFNCAVIDPPWYLEHYRAFIEAGRRLLAPKGKLLISMLPRLTRPQAAVDREQVLTFASERGFELLAVDASSLHYSSPAFEVEALRGEGISLGDWRSADLYSFELTSRPVPETNVRAADGTDPWATYQILSMVVKIKLENGKSDRPFEFKEVPGVADMRLRSVSRRSPARTHINLWTSRNLVAQVTRPDIVSKALGFLQSGVDVPEALARLKADASLDPGESKTLERLLALLLNESQS
jgi:hypothetical protein